MCDFAAFTNTANIAPRIPRYCGIDFQYRTARYSGIYPTLIKSIAMRKSTQVFYSSKSNNISGQILGWADIFQNNRNGLSSSV